MFAFIEGTYEDYELGVAVINCGGIGYEINVPAIYEEILPPLGDTIRLHTQMVVNENTGVSIYGFISRDDLKLFKLLTTVSGVGPKVALGIMSAFTADEIKELISSENAKGLSKAPGVGAKTAARIVVDLKDKIIFTENDIERIVSKGAKKINVNSEKIDAIKEEVLLCLISLGFSRSQSKQAISKVTINEDSDTGEVVKDCFEFLV